MQVLIEPFKNEHGETKVRAVLFVDTPDIPGCQSIREIFEVRVIGDPASCYNVRSLARTLGAYFLNHKFSVKNQGVDFGRATASVTMADKALVQVIRHWQATGSINPKPDPEPEMVNVWLTEAEWQMVQQMRQGA